MLTALGKELRKMRLESGELLKEMADKLNISASYLSSIETGKKSPTNAFINKICSIYNLSLEESAKIKESYFKTINEISISTQNINKNQIDLGLALARKLNNLDSEQITNILNIINKRGDD